MPAPTTAKGAIRRASALLGALSLGIVLALPAPSAGESREAFAIRQQEAHRRESLFSLFFGQPPSLPTERGTLVIRAFHDRNGDGRKNGGEESLRDGLFCRVDEIDYPLPAFVPGLRLNGDFRIDCSAEGAFRPASEGTSVFIGHRGQIVSLDLPFVPATPYRP